MFVPLDVLESVSQVILLLELLRDLVLDVVDDGETDVSSVGVSDWVAIALPAASVATLNNPNTARISAQKRIQGSCRIITIISGS